jgi:hypothetical protein
METEDHEAMLVRGRRTAEDVDAMARANGWVLVKRNDGDGITSALEWIWSVADGGAFLHFIDDPGPETQFFVVRGRRPHTGNIGFALGGSVRTCYEILGTAKSARSVAQKCRAAMDLVVVFVNEDPRALALLRGFYEGSRATVRRYVVAALAYRYWPGGVALLDEIAAKEKDAFIRGQALKTATLWREHVAAQGPQMEP